MELTQDQSKILHGIITSWLETQGIIDKEVDYEISITPIHRKFINLKIHKTDDLDVKLAVTVSDFLKDKKCSGRLMNILNNSNYLKRSLGSLVRCSPPAFKKYRNAGTNTVEELQKLLASEGLYLGMVQERGSLEISAIYEREAEEERRLTNQNA